MIKLTPCASPPLNAAGIEVKALFFKQAPGDKFINVYARYNDGQSWVPLHIGLPSVPSLQQVRDMDRNIYVNSGSFEDAHLYLRSADGNNMTVAFYANAEGGAIQAGNANGLSSLNLQPEGGLLNYGGYEVATKNWTLGQGFINAETDPTVPAWVKAITNAQILSWTGKQDALGFTPENLANKSTAAALGNSNTLYPTQRAVKTYVDNQVTTINTNFIPNTQKGVANGVASLGADGKIPNAQIPALAITDTSVVATEAAMLALAAEVGDVAVRSDVNKTFILKASPATTLGNWVELKSPTVASTDQLIEGSSNLYFTTARARAALSASAPLSYSSASGVFSIAKADSVTNGYLSAADWVIFNAKEPAFAKNTGFNKNFGTVSGTVAQGDDSRILNGQTAFGWGNHAGLYTPLSRTITAGNGLSGGGALNANLTLSMGTPSTITLGSANGATGTTHTHAFTPGGTSAQYIRGDGTLATFPAAPATPNLQTVATVGNTFTGGLVLGGANVGPAAGLQNVRLGINTMTANTGGMTTSVAIGTNVLAAATTGFYNIGIGHDAMSGWVSDPSSEGNNVAVGNSTMSGATAGIGNTMIGSGAGYYGGGQSRGNYNVMIGYAPGQVYSNVGNLGSENIYIGHSTGALNNESNRLLIGNRKSTGLSIIDGNMASEILKFHASVYVRDMPLVAAGNDYVTWNATTQRLERIAPQVNTLDQVTAAGNWTNNKVRFGVNAGTFGDYVNIGSGPGDGFPGVIKALNVTGHSGFAGDLNVTGKLSAPNVWSGDDETKSSIISSYNTTLASGSYNGNGVTGAPVAGWSTMLNMRHSNPSNNYGSQIAFGDFTANIGGNGNAMYWRWMNNGAAAGWRRVWTDYDFNVSFGATANTVVQRDGNGYTQLFYTQFTNPVESATVAQFMVFNGSDNFARKVSLNHVKTALGFDNLSLQAARNVNPNVYDNTTGTGYSTAAIQLRENQGIGAAADPGQAPRIAFHWSGLVASQVRMSQSGRIEVVNNPGTSYENFIAYTVSAADSFRFENNGSFLRSESNYWALYNGGSGAHSLKVNTLVASDNYGDTAPVNGIFSKGGVMTNDWFRSNASSCGWYHEVHAAGIYSDSSMAIKTYNNSSFQVGSINGVGWLRMESGNASNQGYLSFFNPNGTRNGYIGYGTAGMKYTAEQGYHEFVGITGLPIIHAKATTQTQTELASFGGAFNGNYCHLLWSNISAVAYFVTGDPGAYLNDAVPGDGGVRFKNTYRWGPYDGSNSYMHLSPSKFQSNVPIVMGYAATAANSGSFQVLVKDWSTSEIRTIDSAWLGGQWLPNSFAEPYAKPQMDTKGVDTGGGFATGVTQYVGNSNYTIQPVDYFIVCTGMCSINLPNPEEWEGRILELKAAFISGTAVKSEVTLDGPVYDADLKIAHIISNTRGQHLKIQAAYSTIKGVYVWEVIDLNNLDH